MAILDSVLGGGSADEQSSSTNVENWIGTSPQLGVQLSDVLHSENSDGDGGDSSSFTGIGDLGVGFAAPTMIGTSFSSDQHSSGNDNGGGLLGGLL